MAMDNLLGPMVQSIRVNLIRIIYRVWEFTFGLIREDMKVRGNKIK
jgi:hypothetical protein